MSVEVRPAEFSMVLFETGEIVAVTERLLGELGLDRDVVVEVDETTPLGRARVTSLEPVTLSIESGALEDPKAPRQLGREIAADVIGRMLMRVHDRLDPAFGDPPPDKELSLPLSTAWDVYCVGRLARLGYRPQRQRRLYHFRNRHGFTDAADTAFEQLWGADDLTWDAIVAISGEVVATAQPA